MLPYVDVSHLPSSASFYSAITHPLGLRYISANPASIVYGTDSPTDPSTTTPVFEVRNTGNGADPLKHSRLVLSASSSSVVSDFYAAALRANPDLPLIGGADTHFLRPAGPDPSCGESRARITDLEGNIMEVVYLPPQDHPSRFPGSNVRRTHSTTDEASRILDWDFDVAASSPSRSIVAGSRAVGGSATTLARRPAPGVDAEVSPYVLRRSVTTSTIETSPTPRQNSSGLGTGAIVGTVLGAVAAGAAIGGALTYMSMKNQRERAPRQEFDVPGFQRRSTFPDPYPDHKPRYVEVERTVEKIHYPEEYPPAKSRHYPPPSYVARYSQVGSRSREVEELDDRSSRHSSRHSTSGKTRTRSEAGSARRPMMIADTEYRSTAGSKYTAAPAPRMLMEAEHRSHAASRLSSNLLPEADYWSHAPSKHSIPRSIRHHDPEVETYVSARSKKSERSERSESTVKPARPPVAYEEMVIRSRAPSKAPSKVPSRHSAAQSATTMKMMTPMSRAQSYASARMVALPESHIGSSHADWEDDNDSIAPSDSISCVGSRSRSGRSYH
ncbi:hypothetical protein BJ170DRAFT_599801 [Xylariales sp. AK1849]|nr:hypothetical protein BJ170DRAFT_599801 [Xylariales sp. AK1849]